MISQSRELILVFVAALLVLPACQGTPEFVDSRAQADSSIAFTNVNVVPMNRNRVLHDQTVLVRGELIIHVGPAGTVDVPPGTRRMRGDGRYLLPGLVDVHVHLRSTDELLSYLANGVTTIVHMSGAMSGAPDLLQYRDETARGERLGPTLYTTGPILDGDPPVFGGVSTSVSTPEDARRAVDAQYEAGYDFVKVYNNLGPDALVAAVEAAHGRGMAVFGHVPRGPDRSGALQRALDAGLDVIAHGEEYFFTYFYGPVDSLLDRGDIPYPDASKIAEAVRITRQAGAAVVPNLSFVAMTRKMLDDLDGVLANSEAAFLNTDVLELWEEQNPTRRSDLERFDRREVAKYAFLKRLTTELNDAGVPLLLGTDASAPGMYPGASAHMELRELVETGLTPYEALSTGSRNPGAFITKHVNGAVPFGTIEPGYRADLILIRGNPLEEIARTSSIDGVLVRGRWFSKMELDGMRAR